MPILLGGSVFAQQTRPPAKAAPANPEAEKALPDVGVLMQSGEFQEAEEAIRRDARFGPAHGNLGNLLLQQHKLEPAKKELELAIKLTPITRERTATWA